MKKDIRCIAIDLDDTLLHDDNSLSERTIKALQRAHNEGIRILIATGRMYQTAQPVGAALQLGDIPMILYTGGTIQCALSGSILYESPIPKEVSQEVLSFAKKRGWYIQAYVNDELLVDTYADQTAKYERGVGAKAVPVGTDLYTLEEEPLKLLIIDEPDAILAIEKVLKERLGDKVEIVRSKSTFLEIIPFGTSKGKALAAMMERYGIPMEHVMAIGNAPNDISMLDEVGVPVAVANGEPSVRKRASIITASNNEDGVAQVVEQLLDDRL